MNLVLSNNFNNFLVNEHEILRKCVLFYFSGPGFEFFFRVKFYVTDPSKLAEEYTR